MQQPPIFLPYAYYTPQPPGPPMPFPQQLHTFPHPPTMPSPPPHHHQQQPQPNPNPKPPLLPPFSRIEPKTAALIEANHALRLQRQHQERCKRDLAQLHRERRAALAAFQHESDEQVNYTMALELMREENKQWLRPSANTLAEMQKLQDAIEVVEKAMVAAKRRWEELGERIEEKHVEIAFGPSDGD
ncbi:hypothetical protein BDR22DRAFT_886936 [Usnea florida]